ncbi:MAG: PorT family protein [Bacteroidaceae bacterium]|nr:PorT family protein [Bacteroidaceae bacterium]
MTTGHRFHLLLALITICLPASVASAEDGTTSSVVQSTKGKIVNIGFRAGVESSTLMGVKANINDYRFAREEYRNKAYLAGFAGLIARYNFSKLIYFQGEVLFNSNKSCLELDLDNAFPDYYTQNGDSEKEHKGTVTSVFRSIDIPVLVGINLTQSSVYHLSAYCGPTFKIPLKGICKTQFDGFPYQMAEDMKSFMLSGVIGLNCRINTLFFDFSYNIGFSNMSKSLEYDTDNIERSTPVYIKRTIGYLSVAVGMLF